MRKFTVVALALLFHAAQLAAQANVPAASGAEGRAAQPGGSRWSVSVHMGAHISSIARQLERGMRNAGLDQTLVIPPRTCLEGYSTRYPTSSTGGGGSLDLRYRLGEKFRVGIGYSYSNLGEAHGNDNSVPSGVPPSAKGYGIVDVDASLKQFGLFAYYGGRDIQFGAGPSLYIIDVREVTQPRHDISRLGLATQLRLSSGARALFIDLKAEYRLIGSADVGPFQKTGNAAQLPRSSVNFNHAFFGAGVGLRL